MIKHKHLYAAEVDVWSVGCIFYQLVTKNVLFPGDSEIDMLHRIHRIVGKPTRDEWPEMYAPHEALLANPNDPLHQCRLRTSEAMAGIDLEDFGIDLLDVSARCSPRRRCSSATPTTAFPPKSRSST